MKITGNEVDVSVLWVWLKGQSSHTQSWSLVKQWSLRVRLTILSKQQKATEVDTETHA